MQLIGRKQEIDELLDRSISLAQNVDRLFFAPNALLKDEFGTLYK